MLGVTVDEVLVPVGVEDGTVRVDVAVPAGVGDSVGVPADGGSVAVGVGVTVDVAVGVPVGIDVALAAGSEVVGQPPPLPHATVGVVVTVFTGRPETERTAAPQLRRPAPNWSSRPGEPR